MHGSPYFWVGKSPALNYFTSIPFGMMATEYSAWLTFGGGIELWRELYERFDAVPFYAGSSGVQVGGWFMRPVDTLDDLKGLKFHIAGLGGAVLERLGVNAVLLPPGEIGPALLSGAIEGANWIGPWSDIAFGLYQTAKYYYMPGWHEPGPALEMTVGRKVWDSLDDDLKGIIEDAAAATAEQALADFNFHNIEAYPEVAELGAEVQSFSLEIVKAVGVGTAVVLEEHAGTAAFTRRIHDSHMGFLEQARAYSPMWKWGAHHAQR